jgi:Fe-S cluster assembly iron-binding protein IscA
MAKLKETSRDAEGKIYAEPRRTQRVRIGMSVVIRGTEPDQTFEEKTKTVTVNANGCLVLLSTKVKRGQKLKIINPQTQEELACTVCFLGESRDGKSEVAFEFSEAAPKFWRIAFPPNDWDPSERKRAGAPTAKTPPTHAKSS